MCSARQLPMACHTVHTCISFSSISTCLGLRLSPRSSARRAKPCFPQAMAVSAISCHNATSSNPRDAARQYSSSACGTVYCGDTDVLVYNPTRRDFLADASLTAGRAHGEYNSALPSTAPGGCRHAGGTPGCASTGNAAGGRWRLHSSLQRDLLAPRLHSTTQTTGHGSD